ncbi:ABC-2 transporter permease [Paenibacillus sp. FSL R5-0517]|uniref:ABC-2 transporter permease n=1 Tax=Paenibacillus sp. FSL R5-0517 TaxID=2921647 RepID=UPI0030DCCF6B
MLNLLRKDFIVLKSSLWIIALYLVVFSLAFIPQSEMSMYFVGIYTAFGSVILATMIDIRNHNHNFLVTLPISRKQIVKAKYLSAILYTFFGVLASYGIHWLMKLNYSELNKPNYTILDILFAVGIVFVLVSIYMPLFYSLSKKGAAIINAVFMTSLIILAQPVAVLLDIVNEKGRIGVPLMILISMGILLLFFVSYVVTVRLFSRKDL